MLQEPSLEKSAFSNFSRISLDQINKTEQKRETFAAMARESTIEVFYAKISKTAVSPSKQTDSVVGKTSL